MNEHHEEPQTENWIGEFRDRFVHKDYPELVGLCEDAESFISSLLSKIRLEERQRVVRIAEKMKRISENQNGQFAPHSKWNSYNKALSDLSSRVLEEGK